MKAVAEIDDPSQYGNRKEEEDANAAIDEGDTQKEYAFSRLTVVKLT